PVASSGAVAERWHSLAGRRIALPVAPQVGEGLPDIFLRATDRNGEEYPSGLWQAAFGRKKAYFSHRNFVDLVEDDAAFADYLGAPVGESDIAPLRYVRQGPRTVRFFGTTIFVSQLAPHRRVSPSFLASNGYQKAIWSLLPLTFDPGNHEHLMDHCPNPECGAMLTFNQTLGLYHCHSCRNPDTGRATTDLRDFRQPTVDLATYENIDFACSLVDPALDPKRDTVRTLHHDLRCLDRGQVFEFSLLLARLVDRQRGTLLQGAVSPKALDEAALAIRNWPTSVIDLAERVQDTWRFPTLTMGHGSENPVIAEVFHSRNLFGINFFRLVKDQLRSGLAARRPPPKLPETKEQRFRRPRARTAKQDGFRLKDQDDKLLFATVLSRSSKAVRSDFKASGLPFLDLVRLYANGVVRHPDPKLFKFLVENPEHLEDLSTRIHDIAKPDTPGSVSLYKAVTAISGGFLAWPTVVGEVTEGTLRVTMSDGNRPLIHRLRIEDVEHLRKIVSQAVREDWMNDVVLSNYEAGFYIGVSCKEVSTLITSNLLPLNGIKFSDATAFRARYIGGAEIMAILAINQHPHLSVAQALRAIRGVGILPVHYHPSVRDRGVMNEYFSGLGYQC
ncbi:hypothetical protein C9413_04615, partial [Rhizobium sp. SEMIA 4085]|uniref:hypothetical protein n=1 Tax=Rhizobium sp. SEMIA 4085 TaxID=2137761 RepID=UPI0014789EED